MSTLITRWRWAATACRSRHVPALHPSDVRSSIYAASHVCANIPSSSHFSTLNFAFTAANWSIPHGSRPNAPPCARPFASQSEGSSLSRPGSPSGQAEANQANPAKQVTFGSGNLRLYHLTRALKVAECSPEIVCQEVGKRWPEGTPVDLTELHMWVLALQRAHNHCEIVQSLSATKSSLSSFFSAMQYNRMLTSEPSERILVLLEFWLSCDNRVCSTTATIPTRLLPTAEQLDRLARLRAASKPNDSMAIAQAYASFGQLDMLAELSRALPLSEREALASLISRSGRNTAPVAAACLPLAQSPASSSPVSTATDRLHCESMVDPYIKIQELMAEFPAPNGDLLLHTSMATPGAIKRFESLKQQHSPNAPPVTDVLSQVVLHRIISRTHGSVFVWLNLLANLGLTESEWQTLCAHESLMQPVTQMAFEMRGHLTDELQRLTICLSFWCKDKHFGNKTKEWAINELHRLRAADPHSQCWPAIRSIVSVCTIHPIFIKAVSGLLPVAPSFTAKDILAKLSLPTAPNKDQNVSIAVSLPASVAAYNELAAMYAPAMPPRTEVYKRVVAPQVKITAGSVYVWVHLLANGHLSEREWVEMCSVNGGLKPLTLQLFESRANLTCPVHRFAVMLSVWINLPTFSAKIQMWALKQLGHYVQDHPRLSVWADIRSTLSTSNRHKDFCSNALKALAPLEDALYDPLQVSISEFESAPAHPHNPAALDKVGDSTAAPTLPPPMHAIAGAASTESASISRSAPVAATPTFVSVTRVDISPPVIAPFSQSAHADSASVKPSPDTTPTPPTVTPAPLAPSAPAPKQTLESTVRAMPLPAGEGGPDPSTTSIAGSKPITALSTLLTIESRAPVPSDYFKRLVAFDEGQEVYKHHCWDAGDTLLRGADFINYLSFLVNTHKVLPMHPSAAIVWVRWFSEMQFSAKDWDAILMLPRSKFTAANNIMFNNRDRLGHQHWNAVITLQVTLAYGYPSSLQFGKWLVSELTHASKNPDWPQVRDAVTEMINTDVGRSHRPLQLRLLEFLESFDNRSSAAAGDAASLSHPDTVIVSQVPAAACHSSPSVSVSVPAAMVSASEKVLTPSPASVAAPASNLSLPLGSTAPAPASVHVTIHLAQVSCVCYCVQALPSTVVDTIDNDLRSFIAAVYLEMANTMPSRKAVTDTVGKIPKSAVGNEVIGSAIASLLELHPITTKRQQRMVGALFPRIKSVALSKALIRFRPPDIDLKPFQKIVDLAGLQSFDWSFIPPSFAPDGNDALRDALLKRQAESVALLNLRDKGMSPTSVPFLIEMSTAFSHSRRSKDPHFYYQWCQLLFTSNPSESEWQDLLKLDPPFLYAVETAYPRRGQLDLYPVQFLIVYEFWLKLGMNFTNQMLSYVAETAQLYHRHPGLVDSMAKSFSDHGQMSSPSQSLTIARVFANARETDCLAPILEKHPWIALPVLKETTHPSPELIQLLVSTVRTSADLHLPLRDSRIMGRVLYGLSCLGPAAIDLVFYVVTMLRNQNAPFNPFMCTSVLRSLATVAVERKSVLPAMVHFYHEMKTEHNAVTWSAFHHLLSAHLHHQDRRGALFFFIERHNYLAQQRDAELSLAATHQSTSEVVPITASSAELAGSNPVTVTNRDENSPNDNEPGGEPDALKSTIGMDAATAAKTAHLPFGSSTRFVYRDKRAEQLLALLAESRDYGEVFKFYDFLRTQGYPINERMLEIMADAYVGTRNFNARASEFSGMLVDFGYANLFLLMAVGGGTLYVKYKEQTVDNPHEQGILDVDEGDDDGDGDLDHVVMREEEEGLRSLPRDDQLFKRVPDPLAMTPGSTAKSQQVDTAQYLAVHSPGSTAATVPASTLFDRDSQHPSSGNHHLSAAGDISATCPDHLLPVVLDIATQAPSVDAVTDSRDPDSSLGEGDVSGDADGSEAAPEFVAVPENLAFDSCGQTPEPVLGARTMVDVPSSLSITTTT